MEQKTLREWEAKCIQEEPPACRAGCPLNVDVRGFAQAIGKGNDRAARLILDKNMPIASIVAMLCEAPCEQYCLRESLGGAVSIAALEKYCIQAIPTGAKIVRLPKRPKKVAVIGSGPSSLTVAFDLAKKGYPVSVYYQGNVPGSWLVELPESWLPKESLEQEVQRLKTLGVSFIAVEHLDAFHCDLESADAVYIGQDDNIAPGMLDQLGVPEVKTLLLEKDGWFSGGLSAVDHQFRFISDVSQGREAAVSMDRYLQGASLTASRMELRQGQTALVVNTSNVTEQHRIIPVGSSGYTTAEARQEAARCIDCQCLECVKNCVYLQEFGGYPKSYARRIYNNSAIVKGSHQANLFINSCSLCGQCEVVCPNDFSMADLCLDARKTMVQENRMPPSAHWFALEEMRSARTEGALAIHAPGTDNSKLLFFPGCQLAGIRPEQSLHLYDLLLGLNPQTGIWLDCCSAPAHWAGREEEFTEHIALLSEQWKELGCPQIVTGCSSCLKMFRENLPEFTAQSVWSLLAEQPPVVIPCNDMVSRAPIAISDPCTARDDIATQKAVRSLLDTIGMEIAPLKNSEELTECCGFGGLMQSANPKLVEKVTEARVAQTEHETLTYCAMCRDQLAKTGKPVLHILDLLFTDIAHAATEPPASISTRRINRRALKSILLARYPNQVRIEAEPWQQIELNISESVYAILEERRILTDDIQQVLYTSHQTGSFFEHGDTGVRVASAVLGQVTFWVQYSLEGSVHHLEKCWSHRMTIHGGPS